MVIVNVSAALEHPLAVAITLIVAVIVVLLLLIGVNIGILPIPEAARPIEVFEFVQA